VAATPAWHQDLTVEQGKLCEVEGKWRIEVEARWKVGEGIKK